MVFVVLQLGDNGTSGTTIGDPLSKMEAVKLLYVPPSWFTIGPRFAPAGIFEGEIPALGAHQPLFINFRIVESSDLTVLLRPRFRLVPGEILVEILGASALEDAVDNKVRTGASAPVEPTLSFAGVNPEVGNRE